MAQVKRRYRKLSNKITSIRIVPVTLLAKVRYWLKDNGVKYFSDILEKHLRIDAVWSEGSIPHIVHFQEGIQVRNFLRDQSECDSWDDHNFDNQWITVIKTILDKEKQIGLISPFNN